MVFIYLNGNLLEDVFSGPDFRHLFIIFYFHLIWTAEHMVFAFGNLANHTQPWARRSVRLTDSPYGRKREEFTNGWDKSHKSRLLG
jgi:hypothetical protein